MTAVLPQSLYRTKRGLCPGCGAPLSLDSTGATTRCGFCGGTCVLERRLRTIEPEVDGAPLRLYFDAESAEAQKASSTKWVRSDRFRQSLVERPVCPGCGTPADLADDDEDVTTLECRSCGTHARLEHRLWSPPPDPATEIPRPRKQGERGSGQREDADDPETEQLIHRILHERDFATRVALARRFEEWTFINATAARLLPTLLRAAADSGDPRFTYPVAQVICKLLCEGNKDLRNATVRACERHIFDLRCPRPVLFELGMGDGVCCKPLLDAAEYAVRAGDFEYACAALLGVNWIFQRNFEHHAVMGEVLLYRMLYLTGPVLAFALLLAQRQVTGTGFHYPPTTLLHFIDDAAVERPGLIAELDKCFYCGWPADAGEFAQRIAVYQSLKTDASRTAALRHWIRPADGGDEANYAQLVALVEPLFQTPGPLADAADRALREAIYHAPTNRLPAAVHDLIARRRDALPAEVRRAYLQHVPKTPHLDPKALPYWESEPTPTLSAEMQQALDQWKAGLSRAVDVNDENRQAFRDYWETMKETDAELWV